MKRDLSNRGSGVANNKRGVLFQYRTERRKTRFGEVADEGKRTLHEQMREIFMKKDEEK